jgi:hypothetical protein
LAEHLLHNQNILRQQQHQMPSSQPPMGQYQLPHVLPQHVLEIQRRGDEEERCFTTTHTGSYAENVVGVVVPVNSWEEPNNQNQGLADVNCETTTHFVLD